MILGLRQEIYKISQEHLVVPEEKKVIREFPDSPMAKILRSLPGSCVRSLVGELRSHKLRDTAKNKKQTVIKTQTVKVWGCEGQRDTGANPRGKAIWI